MGTLFKLLMFFFIFIMVMRILSRTLFPYIFKRVMARLLFGMDAKQFSKMNQQQKPKREGEVHIEQNKKSSSKKEDDYGEYTDYEEIK